MALLHEFEELTEILIRLTGEARNQGSTQCKAGYSLLQFPDHCTGLRFSVGEIHDGGMAQSRIIPAPCQVRYGS